VTVLARATVVLGADIGALNRVLSEAEQNVANAGKRISDLGTKLTTRLTLPLVAMGALSVKAFGEQADAMERVKAVVRATGGVAGVTADHIEELGSALQETTRFSDDATEAAAAILLTFKSVRNTVGEGNDAFDRTIKLAQDLSSLFRGDLQSAVLQLGKALEDPTTGMALLRRAGVVFSDAQQEVIKHLFETGQVLESQKQLLNAVEGAFGGTAQAMARTPIGKMTLAWNALNDAMEDVGEIISEVLLPAIGAVRDFAKAFKALDITTKRIIVIFGALAAAFGPILIVLGTFITLLPTLGTALAGLAGPVGLALLALGALVAAGLTVAEHWLWLKQQAVALWTFIKDQFFTGVDKVLEGVQILIAELTKLGKAMSALPGMAGAIGRGLAIAMDEAGIATVVARMSVQAMAEESLASAGRTLSEIEKQMDAAADAAALAAKKFVLPKTVVDQPPPTWMAGMKAAADELAKSLGDAARMEAVLGDAFDLAAAQVTAYEVAIQKAIEAGTPLTTAQLQEWLAALRNVRVEADAAAVAQQRWADTLSRAQSAVEAAITPAQELDRTVAALQEAVTLGIITWDQYVAAGERAKKTFDETSEKADKFAQQMKQGLVDIAGRAVDEFVDSIFDAGQSFGEFVRNALRDLAKLILKLELMKLLFPEDGGGLGGLLGLQHGGFLPSGEVALVGEAGPELVRAGHGGMTVTPMPAMQAAPGGVAGGITVPVQLNVAAMDSRDVSRFFQENEASVATAVSRAVQRSVVLRRILGR
jgi:hypothetical protein